MENLVKKAVDDYLATRYTRNSTENETISPVVSTNAGTSGTSMTKKEGRLSSLLNRIRKPTTAAKAATSSTKRVQIKYYRVDPDTGTCKLVRANNDGGPRFLIVNEQTTFMNLRASADNNQKYVTKVESWGSKIFILLGIISSGKLGGSKIQNFSILGLAVLEISQFEFLQKYRPVIYRPELKRL